MGKVTIAYAAPTGMLKGITPAVVSAIRTWVANGIGTAEELFATDTPRLDDIIQPGSLHWIYEQGLPPWVGVVVGRGYKQGSVSVRLRSAEQLLSKKVTRQGLKLVPELTIGAVLREVVQSGVIANSRAPLQLGTFDASGHTFGFLDYADVYETLSKLCAEYGKQFWVDTSLLVHVRDVRGRDLRGQLVLRDNGSSAQLLDVSADEDYLETLNRVVMIGPGSGDISTVDKVALELSASLPLQNSEAIKADKAETVDQLRAVAAEMLRTRGGPRIAVDATLLNVDGIWGHIGLGDLVTLVLPNTLPHNPVHQARITGLERSVDQYRALFEVLPSPVSYAVETWAPQ